ncbi:hypothetical protein SAY87_000384 [Trapa incisa]|uniref:Uncharacterized protein n=1 Tax=Trapa incisa TaxID=236973 RepID=A0AAN7GM58_9MYRT|nr:hypothetical protein SAY87_000384 [Trapa incisa]
MMMDQLSSRNLQVQWHILTTARLKTDASRIRLPSSSFSSPQATALRTDEPRLLPHRHCLPPHRRRCGPRRGPHHVPPQGSEDLRFLRAAPFLLHLQLIRILHLLAIASIRNPNRAAISHFGSSLQLLYSTNQVGFLFIPAGGIDAGRTKYMAATFNVQSFPFSAPLTPVSTSTAGVTPGTGPEVTGGRQNGAGRRRVQSGADYRARVEAGDGGRLGFCISSLTTLGPRPFA